jgi:two-component system sensor histidine kinase YesM
VHGLEKKKGLGSLLVTGREEQGKLVFTVKDDGIGMPREAVNQIMDAPHQLPEDAGHGIGLANVMERIRLNYGDGYGLAIESETDGGTTVTVTVPCIPYEKKSEGEGRALLD